MIASDALRTSTFVLLLLAPWAPARAAETFDATAAARVVTPFVDKETIAVVHADLARVSVAPVVAMLSRFMPDAADDLSRSAKEANERLGALRRDHVTDVYLVVSLGGKSMIPRTLVVLAPGEPKRNLEALRSALNLPWTVGLQVAPAAPPTDRPLDRPELAESLAAAGDAAVQVVLIPPASTRRVIEELVPQLPGQIGGGSSTVLTRGVSWAAVAIDLSPQLAVRLTIKSQDAPAAEALRAKWIDALKRAGQEKEVRQTLPDFDQLAALLTPKVSGDRLVLDLDEKNPAVARLLTATAAAIERARDPAKRSQSMNNLKQIALCMHNYHDSFKHFPPPASHGPGGKPLLSWRVAILPCFGEQEHQLYKQFHLDEAWDGPHNKALIEKMPAVFRSPKSKAAKGRTNYVVPIGGGALYSSPKDEPQFKDITDGTSNTIMTVEVDDRHAVIWTRPDDLVFDPQDPK
ncbi:MAG: DUF1559 domain-containing protein, partial [Thermoguttaceae bacterium]